MNKILHTLKISYKKYGILGLMKRLYLYVFKSLVFVPFLFLVALHDSFFHKKKKKIWLIGERTNEANDNGFAFFKYLVNNHPEVNVYYVIGKKSKYRQMVEKVGPVVVSGTVKHFSLFLQTTVIATSHFGFVEPVNYYLYSQYLEKVFGKKTYVFLQHGVIYNDQSQLLHKKLMNFDFFVTSAKREAMSILERYGYTSDEVLLTGLPRYDGLLKFSTKKEILFMPTRRSYISNKKSFKYSTYFKKIKYLLTSDSLSKMLSQYGYKLVFYPHSEVHKYIDVENLSIESSNVVIKTDSSIQDLLKTCSILITDYSSVFFDVAFMNKPICYYQFDQEEFYSRHYVKGYFDIEVDGFGPVSCSLDGLLLDIKFYLRNNCVNKKEYTDRINKFFQYRDNRNSERIYNRIVSL